MRLTTAENGVRNGSSGAYIRRSDGTTSSLSIPAGNLSSSYRAELHALKAATEHLTDEDCNQQNIVLLPDSLSSLQSLANSPTDLLTQQPVYSVKQQQSSAPVGISTCWLCRKRDCRQTGKGSSKTLSTPPLYLMQRIQYSSETEAEICLETEEQWITSTERAD